MWDDRSRDVGIKGSRMWDDRSIKGCGMKCSPILDALPRDLGWRIVEHAILHIRRPIFSFIVDNRATLRPFEVLGSHSTIYLIPYVTLYLTLPYTLRYLTPYVTLHLALPYTLRYLIPYGTLYLTVPYTLRYLIPPAIRR